MNFKNLHILIVGAHALDGEIMAGALAARCVNEGGKATLLHISNGECGHPRLFPEDYIKQKKIEAKKAASILSAETYFWDIPDTKVENNYENQMHLANDIRKLRPNIVITHWKGSWHPDHVSTHFIVLRGIFLAALLSTDTKYPPHKVNDILFSENWEDLDGFNSNISFDVSETFNVWKKAINSYELIRGNLSVFPYEDYYTSTMRRNGCLNGCKYAQSFISLPEEVKIGLAQLIL